MELKANRKTSPGKSLFRALIVKLLIEQGFRKVDPDRWEFAHASFLRGQTHLLRNIVRRGSSAGGKRAKDAAAPAADGDDMAMVATEVVRLKQEQRAIDDRVASMWRRVQETERRPKRMLAFLLKVVGDAATPDAPGAEAAGGEKRARLLLDGDFGAFGPDAADFAGFYSGGADAAVDAASGSGGGCSFAFGVDTEY
jgi:heat shock transcription factor, other eukaryote